MTIKQLINELKKYPLDTKVVMSNNSLFVDGIYDVTNISYIEYGDREWGDSEVLLEIETDYSKNLI